MIMKTRKNIYITIGIILIVLNLLVDISDFNHIKSQVQKDASGIGYLIGSQLFLIIGLVLLRMSYKLQQRIKRKQLREMIEKIGAWFVTNALNIAGIGKESKPNQIRKIRRKKINNSNEYPEPKICFSFCNVTCKPDVRMVWNIHLNY